MQPKRGRPQEVDAAAIATTAIALFETKGFDAVSMDDVARKTRVSRSTLFRLYPAKADLVWFEAAAIVAFVRESVRELKTVHDLLDTVIAPVLRQVDTPTFAPIARRRLRLIAATPELLNHRTLHEVQGVFAEAFTRLKAPYPALTARTVVAAGFGAILWWAEEKTNISAEEAVRAAFTALR